MSTQTLSELDPHTGNTKITIVKAKDYALLSRRERLLKNVDYMATQIGRLSKMAEEMRREIALLSVE